MAVTMSGHRSQIVSFGHEVRPDLLIAMHTNIIRKFQSLVSRIHRPGEMLGIVPSTMCAGNESSYARKKEEGHIFPNVVRGTSK